MSIIDEPIPVYDLTEYGEVGANYIELRTWLRRVVSCGAASAGLASTRAADTSRRPWGRSGPRRGLGPRMPTIRRASAVCRQNTTKFDPRTQPKMNPLQI